MMDNAERLDELYIKIADMSPHNPEFDIILDEIRILEDLVNPLFELVEEEKELIYCSSNCNGIGCWDCAAIRGGCPEDV
jgi:hypothetical protein